MLLNAKFNHLVKYYPKIIIETKKTGIRPYKFGTFTIEKMQIFSFFFPTFNVSYTKNIMLKNYHIYE